MELMPRPELTDELKEEIYNFAKPLADIIGGGERLPVFYADKADLEDLGFIADGGLELARTSGLGIGDAEEFKNNWEAVTDVFALGNAVAEEWEYLSGPLGFGELSEETEWLRLACIRLAELVS